MSTQPAADEIEAALHRVHDPCSLAARTPVSILEMGLVRDWSWDGGRLSLTMCLTSISCTMSPHFVNAAKEQLLALDGVDAVDIAFDATVTWTEDLMDGEARARLAKRRAEAHKLVRPQQWRDRAATADPPITTRST